MNICRAMHLGELTRSVRPLPASLLLGSAGLDALAALERWMERDARFEL